MMAKPNYHQARKQKELARKSRQQAKQQRRIARAGAIDAGSQVGSAEDAAAETSGARVAGDERN
jgi:hypothetical protein